MNDSNRTETLRVLLDLSEQLDTLNKHLKFQQDEMDNAKDNTTRGIYAGYVSYSKMSIDNLKTKMDALLFNLGIDL